MGNNIDPGTFKHPFTGETFPVRANWQVETKGPKDKLSLPQEAKIWNPSLQKWTNVSPDAITTNKVTFDFGFSSWHNGQKMDINDILHSLYFTIEERHKVMKMIEFLTQDSPQELLKVFKQLLE
ncbi:MAG: hypothetical protein ACRBB5_08050 [Nitrosopumilus sp.]